MIVAVCDVCWSYGNTSLAIAKYETYADWLYCCEDHFTTIQNAGMKYRLLDEPGDFTCLEEEVSDVGET